MDLKDIYEKLEKIEPVRYEFRYRRISINGKKTMGWAVYLNNQLIKCNLDVKVLRQEFC